MQDIFEQANRASGFWLPAVLGALVKVPPALCQADGCSIYLSWARTSGMPPLLHLAATTREESEPHLFDRDSAYELNESAYLQAVDDQKDGTSSTPRVGLTGWVATFGVALNVANLHKVSERQDFVRDKKLPLPLWSPRNRHYNDSDTASPKPLLIVPIGKGRPAIGAIRVATLRHRPRAFSPAVQQQLQDFADALHDFLTQRNALAEPGLDHYFRIWASRGTSEVADRVTLAVPEVCKVNSCALFLRNRPSTRYVLRHAHAAGLEEEKLERFRRFADGNRNILYYNEADDARTTLCLKEHAPVLLNLKHGRWERVGAEPAPSANGAEGVPADVDGRSSRPPPETKPHGHHLVHLATDVPGCEFDQNPAFMALVPIRDVGSPRHYAGVLRAISIEARNEDEAKSILSRLELFADALATVLGRSWQDDVQQSLRSHLMKIMRSAEGGQGWDRLSKAVTAIGEALNAGAATLWYRDGDTLRTRPELCWLSPKYGLGLGAPDQVQRHHQHFTGQLKPYTIGMGRTGWVAEHGEVLNLKSADDRAEMERHAARAAEPGSEKRFRYSPPWCEFEKPGPLLAVPIRLGPNRAVDGVIRLVRRAATSHGMFTPAHEEILVNSSYFLAEILREGRPWKAVISYKTGDNDYNLHTVAGWVRQLEGQPLFLPAQDQGKPRAKFDEFCRDATLAITIATPDKDGGPSDAVKDELIIIGTMEHLRQRHIVFKRQDVTTLSSSAMDPMDDRVVWPFGSESDAIKMLHEKFLAQLKTWDIVQVR